LKKKLFSKVNYKLGLEALQQCLRDDGRSTIVSVTSRAV